MGSFRDEEYEKLDYLSQLTEIVVGPQNEILGKVPDRIELSFDQINKSKSKSWGSIPGYNLDVFKILLNLFPTTSISHIEDIKTYFKFEVSDDFELDISNKKMVGTLSIVKTIDQIDEKKLLEISVNRAIRELSAYNWPTKGLSDRTITILNTLEPNSGTEWAKNLVEAKTSYVCKQAIASSIKDVILENKWRVRNLEVILKIGRWINSYMTNKQDGELGLVNLVKLKFMLDKDLPVYSIDEVKNAVSL